MCEQVSHGTATEIPEPAPVPKLLLIERLLGSSSEPAFPVRQVCLYRLLRFTLTLIVLMPIRSDLCHSPDVSALDQFDGALEVNPAPLLHSTLQNEVRCTRCPRQYFTFFDSVRARLFQVDEFARSE